MRLWPAYPNFAWHFCAALVGAAFACAALAGGSPVAQAAARLASVPAGVSLLSGDLPTSGSRWPHAAQANLYRLYAAELATLRSEVEGNLSWLEKRKRITQALQAKNRDLVLELSRLAGIPKMDPGPLAPKSSLSRSEARHVRQALLLNPIAGSAGVPQYDPRQTIGFCFGRAAYAHAHLLQFTKVSAAAIGKIFVLGDLRYKQSLWTYHVAVFVLATEPDDKIWVIDSHFDDVLNLEGWMVQTAKWDATPAHPTVRYYATDPAKFKPELGPYRLQDLMTPEHGFYFRDLLEWFRQNPNGYFTNSTPTLKGRKQ